MFAKHSSEISGCNYSQEVCASKGKLQLMFLPCMYFKQEQLSMQCMRKHKNGNLHQGLKTCFTNENHFYPKKASMKRHIKLFFI